jgi:transposase, IS30 family
MDYTHLTRSERYQIQALRKAGLTRAAIAAQLNRHPATIGRELARGTQHHCGYHADYAQSLARIRRLGSANAPRIDPSAWLFAQARLAQQWSPEEIAGQLRAGGLPSASPETLYRRIYADKRRGGVLWRQLRRQMRLRKRYGQHDRRGRRCAPGAVSIDHRPAIVDTRATFGHWEGDTMIDSYGEGALVSVVERKSGYTLLARVNRRKASLVCGAVTRLLMPFRQLADTLTLDNGKEFYEHQEIRSGASNAVLLRSTLRALAARDQRKYQRLDPPVLPQETRDQDHRRLRDTAGDATPEYAPAQTPRI